MKGNDAGEQLLELISSQEYFAMTHRWSDEEYPLLAAWIRANEKPFEILMEGSRLSRFFIPRVAVKDQLVVHFGVLEFGLEGLEVFLGGVRVVGPMQHQHRS